MGEETITQQKGAPWNMKDSAPKKRGFAMDELKQLLDYQRFAWNPRLQKQIDSVYQRYLAQGKALSDDLLDVAAAGEPWTKDPHQKPPGAGGKPW